MKRTHKALLAMAILLLTALATGCGGGSDQSEADDQQTAQTQPEQGVQAQAAQADAPAKQAPSGKVGGQPGDTAPDFALQSLAGETVSMSDLRGEVVIVDFWATWCGPCKLALPHLQAIHDQYGDKGVTIVAIAMDRSGEKVVRPFAEKQDLRFKVVLPDGKVDRRFGGVFGYPTTFIVAPDGTIHKKYIGYQPKAVLLRDIMELKPELAS